MPDRVALVIDEDAEFRERLTPLLAEVGLRAEIASSDEEAMDCMRRQVPEAVFLAVDLPDKEGYSLFSKLKKARRRVPIVIVTATILPADLKLHEKLKIHAEVYLDKRTLTDDDLRETLRTKLGIAEIEEAPAREPVDIVETRVEALKEAKPAAPPKTTIEPWLAKLLDPETAAILADVDDSSVSIARIARRSSDTATGELSPEHQAELEAEVESLRRELDLARQDARSSPFSSEFLVLRESASLKDKEIRGLKEAVGRRDVQAAVIKAKLAEFARRYLEAEKERDRGTEEVSRLEGELEKLQEKLSRLGRDLEEWVGKHEEEAKARREDALRQDEARSGLESEMAELRAAHARQLEEVARERDRGTEQVSDLKGELEGAQAKLQRLGREIEEQERKHEEEAKVLREDVGREEEARRGLESEMAELRAAHARELQARDAGHASLLDALEGKLQDQKGRLADELKSKYVERLNEIQSSHGRALATLREEHEKELLSVHSSYHEAAARTAAEAQESLREASEKSAAALDEANRQRVAELTEAEEKRRLDLELAEKRHREELEALSAAHAAEKETLSRESDSSAARIERISAEFGAKVQDIAKGLEEEKKSHQETREHYEREIASRDATYSKHLEQAEQDQFSALAALSRKFRDEKTRLMDAERQKWEDTARTLHQDHIQALEGLEKQYQAEVEKLKAAQDSALRQKDAEAEQARMMEVERVRAQLQEDVDRARRLNADETAALRQEHEKELSALRSAHMEAIQKRDREYQFTIRDAVEAAKAEMFDRNDRAREEGIEALAALRRDYEEEIAALEKAHQQAVSKHENDAREGIRRAEEERDQARVFADDVRVQMAEMEARHRSSLTLLGEKHNSEMREATKSFKSTIAQLEEEKQFLSTSTEKLKRQSATDLTRAQDSLAHEKKLHQGSTERHERRLAELNVRHVEGIKQIEKDWIAKFELLEKSFAEKADKVASTQEREWRERLEKERHGHEEATEALNRNFEMELGAMRLEIERTRALDESYQAASRDVSAMKSRVDELTQSLADAHSQLADRDLALQEQARCIAENTRIIDSLKEKSNEAASQEVSAMKELIDELTRSVADAHIEISDRDLALQELTRRLSDHARTIDSLREEAQQAASGDASAMESRLDELTQSLTEAHNEIADRDRALQDQTRRMAENTRTIDSLKAVIDDFSRSVESYMRDREESDQTISSLKAVIDDFYRGIHGKGPSERKN